MGRLVACRECDTEVELPDVPKSGKVYRCPDCREPLPLPKAAKSRPADDEQPEERRSRRDEDDGEERPRKRRPRDEDEEDDAPPRRKKRSRREPEPKPFWQSKQGKILSGLLLLGLGVGVLALSIGFDARRPIRGYIGGGLCVVLGLGGIIAGLTSSGDDDE